MAERICHRLGAAPTGREPWLALDLTPGGVTSPVADGVTTPGAKSTSVTEPRRFGEPKPGVGAEQDRGSYAGRREQQRRPR